VEAHRSILYDRSKAEQAGSAAVDTALGDASRTRLLAAMMDGRARTASELALEGEVAPSTASSHLARLAKAGIVAVAKQGRHRYFRLADAETAAALESLMALSTRRSQRRLGPADAELRAARVCYDHLAGEAGVRLLRSLQSRGYLRDGAEPALTAVGGHWCGEIGIDLAALQAGRRPLCRACLDWSERRDHLAGALGAALLRRLLALGHARRQPHSRALKLDARGERFIAELR
jgi:DNA-binding transcriptional ArsR family regulator